MVIFQTALSRRVTTHIELRLKNGLVVLVVLGHTTPRMTGVDVGKWRSGQVLLSVVGRQLHGSPFIQMQYASFRWSEKVFIANKSTSFLERKPGPTSGFDTPLFGIRSHRAERSRVVARMPPGSGEKGKPSLAHASCS
jgi:hypothetical protein